MAALATSLITFLATHPEFWSAVANFWQMLQGHQDAGHALAAAHNDAVQKAIAEARAKVEGPQSAA